METRDDIRVRNEGKMHMERNDSWNDTDKDW